MKKVFLLLTIASTVFAAAQTTATCACCTDKHKQFDFWIGHWDVYDTTGKKVGENKIDVIEGGCGLRENWKSNTQTGTSNNYYNPGDSSWNQLWIDNVGTILVLKGKFADNKMVMKSEMQKGKKVAYYYNMISWEKNKDGSVTQIWDVRDNNDKFLQRAFKGIYRKKEASNNKQTK